MKRGYLSPFPACAWMVCLARAVLRYTKESTTPWGGSARYAELDGDRGQTHRLVLLPQFLEQAEAETLLRFGELDNFRKDADSVDQLPTHELRLIEMGRPSKGRPPEASKLLGKKGFGGRVQRYVRELYVQANSSSVSRQYLGLDVGDAVVHQYDLRHGVQIHSGTRISIILWVKDSTDSCKEGSAPWYFDSAHKGDADGQYHVGSAYLSGMGVDVEPSTAVKWLRKAADQGQPDAQRRLGLMHRQGEGGLRKDATLAEQLLRKAAAAQAMAAFDLGQHLVEQGRPVEAAEFLRASAAENYTQAMVNLGIMLEQGEGDLESNVTEAEMWLRRAADIGDPKAQNGLADLIAFKLVPGSEQTAEDWYRKAAKQGHDGAQRQLAVREAAAAGDVVAQQALAQFLNQATRTSEEKAEL